MNIRKLLLRIDWSQIWGILWPVLLIAALIVLAFDKWKGAIVVFAFAAGCFYMARRR